MPATRFRRHVNFVGVAGALSFAAIACHGDGRDPGYNNRAGSYVTPASNLPAPSIPPATNTPTASRAAEAPAPGAQRTDTAARDTTKRADTAATRRP